MSLLVDTSQVAPSERFELWAEEASKVFFPMSVEQGSPATFSGLVHGCELGPVGVHRLTAGPSSVLRTRRTIGAADPETFQLGFELRGRSSLEQDGRSCALPAGAMFGYQTSTPFVIRNETAFQMLVISFPLTLLRPFTDRVARRTGTRIDHELARRFVAPFLIDLDARISDDSLAAAGPDLGETIVDVVRSMFLNREPGASEPRHPDTLLPQVTRYVYRHLADPELTPARIAAAHFISTRSLHRLWEPHGVGLAEWIRELRLARCRRDLADPGLAGESVAAIAARWGIRNAAHFSRLYRSAYGCSPREHRRQG
jgi:AraC-like DNA-binding protein